jgi:hypothetical protein
LSPRAIGINSGDLSIKSPNSIWRFLIGKNFGVDENGCLHAAGADITGKIKATEGEIGGCSISSGKLQIDAANITSGTFGTARIADGAITSAKIQSLSADKISGGTIDAKKVVISGALTSATISASNLTTGTINANSITISGNLSAATISASKITGGTNNSSSKITFAGNVEMQNINATGGKIAGWYVDGTDLYTDYDKQGNTYKRVKLKPDGIFY